MSLFGIAEGQILEVSDSLVALFGASRAEMVGRPVLDFVIDEAATRARWELMAAGELDGYQITGRGYRRLDGSKFTVDTSVNSVGEGGSRRCAVGVLTPWSSFAFTDVGRAPVVGRVWELERVLQHIAQQIAATGVLEGSWTASTATRVPALSGLTSRELEIVRRLLVGDRVPMIAQQLFLSESTVRNHLTSVYRKLGVRSQQQLLSLLRAEHVPAKSGGFA